MILIAATPISPANFITTMLKKKVVIPDDASLTISDEPLRKQCPIYFQSFLNLTNFSFVSANMKYAPPTIMMTTMPPRLAYAAPSIPIPIGPINM